MIEPYPSALGNGSEVVGEDGGENLEAFMEEGTIVLVMKDELEFPGEQGLSGAGDGGCSR